MDEDSLSDLSLQPVIECVELPTVFEPGEVSDYTREEYLQRIDQLRSKLHKRDLDFGVIYADREHSGNLNYFTGIFSPFEETILVIPRDEKESYLLSGNEIVDGMIHLSPILDELYPIRIQSFSLQGFFRDQSYQNRTLLSDTFREIGIAEESRIGLIGWKYLEEAEVDDPHDKHFVPGWIVDCLREISSRENVINASDIMFNPIDGLRIIHDAHQLATIERNSTLLTNIVNEVFSELEVGMSEVDVARCIQFSGEHYLYYPIICIGEERIRLAYAMPSAEYKLSEGEQILISLGFGGAAHAREGRFVSHDKISNETPTHEIYSQFFILKYLWLSNLALGKTGNELFQLVDQVYDREFFINPGHNIDEYQEWTNSIFRRDEPNLLRSGMVFHIDIITQTFNNDTIAIASKELREQLNTEYPETFSRIQYRRNYLQEVIGVKLDESVLPFSDNLLIQPYLQSLDYVFVNTS
jgi:Xaa-Pro aminopeptidase